MSGGVLKVALIQTSARRDMAENLAVIGDLVRKAKAAGAAFALTPENVTMI